VKLASNIDFDYDYLVLATGATHSYFGHDEWSKLAPGLKTIEDAIEIRRRVLLAFELAERQMVETGTHPPLNFVIIGGGPTGVELAGAISDITKIYMMRDFRHINPAMANVVILEGSPTILSAYPPDLRQKAVEQLNHLGAQVRTGAHVTDVQPGYVMVGDERISSVVTLWAAGVQASPLGKLLGCPTDKRGAVIVDRYLNPPGHTDVFVCGDLAHVEENGRQIPGVAQPAMQMGDHVGRMVRQDLDNKPRTPFHYFDKGDMATIGRSAAIAKLEWPFKAHWSGFPAWVAWLVVHIFFLIGFRNRAFVFFEWAWTDFTSNFGARLITGSQILPGWDQQRGAVPQSTAAAMDPTSPAMEDKPART
jgi:NADH dehydrogenase